MTNKDVSVSVLISNIIPENINDIKNLKPNANEYLNSMKNDMDIEKLSYIKSIWNNFNLLNKYALNNYSNLFIHELVCLLRANELNIYNIDVKIGIIWYFQKLSLYKYALNYGNYLLYIYYNNNNNIRLNNETLTLIYDLQSRNYYDLKLYNKLYQLTLIYINKHKMNKSNILYWNFLSCIKLNKYNDAVNIMTKLINKDNKKISYYNDRCYCYGELKLFDKALDDANYAIKLDSNNKIALNNRGATLNDLKQYNDALKDLTKCIQLSGETYKNAYRHRAYSFWYLNNYNNAIIDIQKALFIDKNYQSAIDLFNIIYDSYYNWINNAIIFIENNNIIKNNESYALMMLIPHILSYAIGNKIKY